MLIQSRLLISFFFLLLFLSIPGYSSETDDSDKKVQNYAVLNLKNGEGIKPSEVGIISDRLRNELFNQDGVEIMERQNMKGILKEQGFQQSGVCSDKECMVEMGRILNVDIMVSGSIGKLGSLIVVNLRSIDVSTARIIQTTSYDINGDLSKILNVLPQIAANLVGNEKEIEDSDVSLREENDKTADNADINASKEKNIDKGSQSSEKGDKKDNKDNEAPVIEKEIEKEIDKEGVEDEVETHPKKRNSGGVRISASFFFNTPKGIDMYEEEVSLTDIKSVIKEYESFLSSEEFDYNLKMEFLIPIGDFVTIDVGPEFNVFKANYKADDDERYSSPYTPSDYGGPDGFSLEIYSPGVSVGMGFTLRLFPIKFNLGVNTDIRLNIMKGNTILESNDLFSYDEDTTYSAQYESSFRDSLGRDVSLNVALMPKAGIEIQPSENFGIFINYTYRFSTVPLNDVRLPKVYKYDYSNDRLNLKEVVEEESGELKMWSSAINTGVVFYW